MNGWIMKLVAFGLLSTVVLNLMPKEGYQRYMRLVLGFLLLLILASPILSVTNLEDGFHAMFARLYSSVEHFEQTSEYEQAKQEYEALLHSLYEKNVEEMGEEPWMMQEEELETPQGLQEKELETP